MSSRKFPAHGWLGAALITIFWPLNWVLPGPRTHWGFFPLWLGYCLAMDGLVLRRTGTSLLTRSWRKYIGLFLISAPVWWLFEVLNWRLQNWHYDGRELFTDLEYGLLASVAFSTVIPAVFGTAELISSFAWVRRLGRGPKISADNRTTTGFFLAGWIMLSLMLIWPRYLFPFIWLSIYFIMEPINIWLGNRNLVLGTQERDWRPVIALWVGVLITAFFWEFWNFHAYPKWIYTVPFVDFWHIFEMPLLGYGGYLPFALELYAVYHLVLGVLGDKNNTYIQLGK
ncbi:MAG: hypothetical protein ISS57_18705 [Anaerolineales bacterium]|nr:hypothetical protein [Anaerolineales bacterium]